MRPEVPEISNFPHVPSGSVNRLGLKTGTVRQPRQQTRFRCSTHFISPAARNAPSMTSWIPSGVRG